MEYVTSLITIVVFFFGMFKFWNTDGFEMLSFDNSGKLYKFILDFLKKISIYFIYLFLLGQYYHMFNIFVNDYSGIYFLIFFFAFILSSIIVVFSWIYIKNKKNILEDYKTEFQIINVLKKLSFTYLVITIWLLLAKNYNVKDLSYFYSTDNIKNVLFLSITIAFFANFFSLILSYFEDIIKSKKYYYISDYPDYLIIKNSEGNYMKLKNEIDSSIMYIKYDEIYQEEKRLFAN